MAGDMNQKTYAEKLKDPRWQKRRLQILERDGWACVKCGEKEKTLHVHHWWYRGEPWEAPDDALSTVCVDCHELDYALRRDAEEKLRCMEDRLAHVSRLSAMGEMVAGIAHELNQPLYSILNFAKASKNLLMSESGLDLDELREWNEDIEASAARAGAARGRR